MLTASPATEPRQRVVRAGWLATHLWEHYEYGGDLAFLREVAYPVLRDAAEFLLAYLSEDPATGHLVAGPSESPENWYVAPDGSRCSIAMGNTVDRVFAAAIIQDCSAAAEILNLDAELRVRITAALARLSPYQIGRHGQLQEWLHDFEDADPAHRHTSHLCALFPERQITPDASEANLMSYSVGGVAGAAQNIYSFDGNAGGTATVAELLVQSDLTELELLPALPTTWPDGSVRGLRARGGLTVDLTWADGRLEHATIHPSHHPSQTGPHRIRYGEDTLDLTLTSQEPITISAS